MSQAQYFPMNSMTVTNAPELENARETADEIVVSGEDWFQQYALKQLGFHDGRASARPSNGVLAALQSMFASDPMASESLGVVGKIVRFVRILFSVCLLVGCIYFAQLSMVFLLDWFVGRNRGDFFPRGGLVTPLIYAVVAIVGTIVVYAIVMRLDGIRGPVEERWTIASREHGRLVIRKVMEPVGR